MDDIRISKCYRQGEIVFIKLENIPNVNQWDEKPTLKGNNVIREGETTGHAHTIEGTGFNLYNQVDRYQYYRPDTNSGTTSFRLPEGDMYLTTDNTIEIKHQEHQALKLDKGDYIIRIQREYDEIKDRQVVD